MCTGRAYLSFITLWVIGFISSTHELSLVCFYVHIVIVLTKCAECRRLSVYVFRRPIGSGEGLHILTSHTMCAECGTARDHRWQRRRSTAGTPPSAGSTCGSGTCPGSQGRSGRKGRSISLKYGTERSLRVTVSA
jgi:hypothetical protein